MLAFNIIYFLHFLENYLEKSCRFVCKELFLLKKKVQVENCCHMFLSKQKNKTRLQNIKFRLNKIRSYLQFKLLIYF